MGSFRLKLVGWFALLALLPLAFAFYGFDTIALTSETKRADTALQAGLRSAVASYAAQIDAATARARELAASPSVQTAMRKEDLVTLRRLLPVRPSAPRIARSVRVIDGGRLVGVVTTWVAVDAQLLATLHMGLAPGDVLVALRHGRVVSGRGLGEPMTLAPGSAARVTLAGRGYRALATAPLGTPGIQLAALTPQSKIDAAANASERKIGAALGAALVLLIAATYLLGRSIVRTLGRLAGAANAIASGRLDERVTIQGNDEFAQVGRAFNHMAGQLELRLHELEQERLRVQRANARFGEALTATHDPGQLVRVVVESAVEGTGATGGVVRGDEGEIARVGDQDGPERITLPLSIGESEFGELVLFAQRPFEPPAIEAAASLAAQVVVALENARLHRIVERQALVDGLTGLANRRSVEETLRVELARAARFGDTVAVVLADLDDFKAVNDQHGHAAGDDVLKAFAGVLRDTVRESDTAGRWGGEEFALVLTGTDLAGGMQLAERARRAIEQHPVRLSDGTEVTVTASFGVAAHPHRGDLVSAADGALYEAKRAGKNRVSAAHEAPSEKMV